MDSLNSDQSALLIISMTVAGLPVTDRPVCICLEIKKDCVEKLKTSYQQLCEQK